MATERLLPNNKIAVLIFTFVRLKLLVIYMDDIGAANRTITNNNLLFLCERNCRRRAGGNYMVNSRKNAFG